MRFLLDESTDFRLLDHLRALDHDVTSIVRQHRPGMTDRQVLSAAVNERRILITNDRDLANWSFALNCRTQASSSSD